MPTLDVQRDGPVERVTLNRPDVRNALNDELIAELTEWASSRRAASEVRVAVLGGAGKTFSAGADVTWMSKAIAYTKEENQRDAERLSALFAALDRLPVPLIGRIQGAALGGGSGLAAVCDVVTMDPDTPAGGVPGISPTSYGPGQTITDAFNDFGCRFDFRNSSSPCTMDEHGFDFVSDESTAQFCTIGTVDVFWRFPFGDTRLTARWRDQSGVLGPPRSIIIRVMSQ